MGRYLSVSTIGKIICCQILDLYLLPPATTGFGMTAQRLVQDIELARRHARYTSQDVKFFVSFNKNFYSIDPLDSPLRPSSTYQVVFEGAFLCPIIDGLLSPASRSTQTDLTITFDRYGVPNSAASIGIACGESSGTVQLSQEGQVSRQ